MALSFFSKCLKKAWVNSTILVPDIEVSTAGGVGNSVLSTGAGGGGGGWGDGDSEAGAAGGNCCAEDVGSGRPTSSAFRVG